VKAVIEPAAGVAGDDRLREEILAFCADRLARYKTPRTIDFIAEMPRDPNGKLYKRKLRDPYWAGRDRQI
jgi:long-chain acyl-CoA synthetase